MGIDNAGSPVTDTETAGAVARPPLLFLSALLLGLAVDHLLPLAFKIPRTDMHRFIAGTLLLVGMAVFAASVRDFSTAGTPVQGTKPTRALVTSGIFGWSRNPIYVGMFLLYVGIGVAVRSTSILALTLPLALVMRYGVIAREETYLERRFGEAYRAYKTRVRRLL